MLGTIFDCFVWYYAKGLKIYDEDFENPNNIQDERKNISKNNNTKNDVELPLISISGNVENK